MIIKDSMTFLSEKKGDVVMQQQYPDDPVKNAIWNYVAGYTVGEINNQLRKGKINQTHRDAMELMDKAFVKKMKIDVYRTVEWEYLTNIYGITKENIDEFVGKELVSHAYTSTSIERINAWGATVRWDDDDIMHECLMHIVSERPIPYIRINEMFKKEEIDCSFQNEILLPRELTYVLTGYEKMDKYGNFDSKRKKNVYCLELTIK